MPVREAMAGSDLPSTPGEQRLPDRPGLYCVWLSADGWSQIERGARALGALAESTQWSATQPAYIGKAEKSLRQRDGRAHFGDGPSSRSTLRRTIAALVGSQHGWTPRPRAYGRRATTARDAINYELAPHEEAALTRWLHTHAELGWWQVPEGEDVDLGQIEREFIASHSPALNIKHNRGSGSPWPEAARRARASMVTAARETAQ